MVLTEEQAALFYKLWIPLLDFVNRKYKLNRELFDMTAPEGLPKEEVMKISTKLWENVAVIDEYLKANSQKLTEEEASIVADWKKAVGGEFIVDRHLKSGSVLISLDDEDKIYIVRGIFSTWWELLGNFPLPQMIKATLIPFQGSIIHDGIIQPFKICLGKTMADEARQHYLKAKAENRIQKSL